MIDTLILEVAGRCQRSCGRCYVPLGRFDTPGWMTFEAWRRVITDAAGLAVRRLLLVGGEPTSNPALPDLIDHSLAASMEVQLWTNLVKVSSRLWEAFSQPGVQIATSISGDPATHHPASDRAGARAQTLTNLRVAVNRGITLHVGLVCLAMGDDDLARRLPPGLSVSRIDRDPACGVGHGVDHSRGMSGGRGTCGLRRAAVLADGRVTPCVTARGDTSGNVRDTALGQLLAGQRWSNVVAAARTKASSGGCV
ncbi:conserved hypothetical protein [Frankia sp. AiPs1]|uniref:radical SAM/SPASM domain-containing protein n=1 Tax=Frankia sp. AiPa1 TaxID=573492 RepID=UPI00202B2694|nr:radical SAM protein [Frankia sp. AiPa1]MCL9759280.1 radical SAM protein [Frankia sp. AiPa1]